MIRHRHGKTLYELLHNKPPDLSYLHVFGALCYPTNDNENLGKLQPKVDIGKDIKVKKSKNKQKPTRNEETSDQEKDLKPISKAGSRPWLRKDKKVIEQSMARTLELGKSISLTEAEEVEAARKVHATHARIMTETVPEPDRRRPSGKVTSDPSKKLKSVISLNPKEQEAADTMKTQMKELVAVSLNLLSRTRKFGHSTMELRSLIS
ncbi:hypothetical protein Tco_1418686 [Tanacetum coccineum]